MKYRGYRFSTVWLNGGKFLRLHRHGDALWHKRRLLPVGCSSKRKQLRPHMDALLALEVLES